MSQKKMILVASLVALLVNPVQSGAQEYTEEAALRDAYEAEMKQKTRLEELARKKARMEAEQEKRSKEIQQEIQAKNLQTEDYKAKAEELARQIEALHVEIFDLKVRRQNADKEIQYNEQKFQKTQAEFESYLKEFNQNKEQLEGKQQDLKAVKERVDSQVVKNRLEVQRMKQDMGNMEAEMSAIDAQKADLEAAEMKTRVEWLAVKKQLSDRFEQKQAYLDEAEQAQKRVVAANKDLALAQDQLERANRENVALAAKTRSDIEKYEREMQELSRKRTQALADKMRLENEAEKIKTYAMQAGEARNQAAAQTEAASDALLESRVALEAARTDLKSEEGKMKSQDFAVVKSNARVRGLASAGEAAKIVGGSRIFVTSRSCPAFRRPSSTSKELLQLESGRRVMGEETAGNWIRVSSEGKSVYVDSSCGSFEE